MRLLYLTELELSSLGNLLLERFSVFLFLFLEGCFCEETCSEITCLSFKSEQLVLAQVSHFFLQNLEIIRFLSIILKACACF